MINILLSVANIMHEIIASYIFLYTMQCLVIFKWMYTLHLNFVCVCVCVCYKTKLDHCFDCVCAECGKTRRTRSDLKETWNHPCDPPSDQHQELISPKKSEQSCDLPQTGLGLQKNINRRVNFLLSEQFSATQQNWVWSDACVLFLLWFYYWSCEWNRRKIWLHVHSRDSNFPLAQRMSPPHSLSSSPLVSSLSSSVRLSVVKELIYLQPSKDEYSTAHHVHCTFPASTDRSTQRDGTWVKVHVSTLLDYIWSIWSESKNAPCF